MTDPVVPSRTNINERRSEKRGNIMFTKQREARGQERQRTRQAAIYLRGSRKDVAEPIKAPSINKQRAACQDMAKVLHADVIGEFIDKARTPLSDPGINRLMVVVSASPWIDYLIVYSLDQLTPDRDEVLKIKRLFRSAAMVLVVVADGGSPWTSAGSPS